MSPLSLAVPLTVSLTGDHATAIARVTNASGANVRAALIALSPATGSGGEAWTAVTDPLREIPAGGADDFALTFTPPRGLPGGDYRVRLIAYPADEVPEEYADQAREIVVTVPAAVPPPPRRAWWPYAAAAALLVVAVVVTLLVGPHRPPPPPPTTSPTSASPTPTPQFDAADVRVLGSTLLRVEAWGLVHAERTVQVDKAIRVRAGTPADFTWGACVGGTVQTYLDLQLTLDRVTGRVRVTGQARYYQGASCGVTNLRRQDGVWVTVDQGSTENYLESMHDAMATVEYRLAISNVPVSPGEP